MYFKRCFIFVFFNIKPTISIHLVFVTSTLKPCPRPLFVTSITNTWSKFVKKTTQFIITSFPESVENDHKITIKHLLSIFFEHYYFMDFFELFE